MSQSFVNSGWCKQEFALCFVENVNDPAFKLFAIMMQPAEELENLSDYMANFIAHKTYLHKEDPNLFNKIGEYLRRVREPRNDADEGDNEV